MLATLTGINLYIILALFIGAILGFTAAGLCQASRQDDSGRVPWDHGNRAYRQPHDYPYHPLRLVK